MYSHNNYGAEGDETMKIQTRIYLLIISFLGIAVGLFLGSWYADLYRYVSSFISFAVAGLFGLFWVFLLYDSEKEAIWEVSYEIS